MPVRNTSVLSIAAVIETNYQHFYPYPVILMSIVGIKAAFPGRIDRYLRQPGRVRDKGANCEY